MKTFLKILGIVVILGALVWAVVLYRPEILTTLHLTEEKTPENTENIAESKTPEYQNPGYQEYIEKGIDYAQNGFYDFAIQEFFSAMELEPENREAYALLGRAQMQIKDWTHAVMSLSNARKYGDDKIETVSLLVRALIQSGKFEQAREIFLNFDEGSQEEEVLYLRGLLAVLDNNREVAGGSFAKLLELYPESGYKDEVNKYLEAYKEFDLFQDGHPMHIKTLLARALNENGQYTMAVEILKNVIQEKADYRDAWILLGYAQYARGEYVAGKNALEKAVELDPTKPEAQYFLGLTYAEMGEKDSAIRALEMSLEDGFTPETQVISKLAQIYLDNLDYQKAAETYENYLAKGGNAMLTNYVRPVWIYLDYVNTAEGYAKAVALSREAVTKFDDQALAHNLLGWSLIYTEEYTEAFAELNKAKALDPNMAAIYLNFGIWYEKQGSLDTAKKNYNTAYEKGNGDSISNTAAKRYNELIEKEEAEAKARTEAEQNSQK